MIITEANSIAAEIHNRMPVLLAPERFEPRLSGEVGIEYLNPRPMICCINGQCRTASIARKRQPTIQV
jgi:hypothetical protein